MSRVRVVFMAPLLALGAWLAISATPSVAQPPMENGCLRVSPSSFGAFGTNGCDDEVGSGSYVLQQLLPGRLLLFCIMLLAAPESPSPTCRGGSGTKRYSFAMGRIGGETVKIVGVTSYTIKGTISAIESAVSCASLKAVNPVIEGGEPTKTTAESLEYSSCSVAKPTNCVVATSGRAEGVVATGAITEELVENTSKTKVEDLLSPTTGKTFVEFVFKNKESKECSLKGTTAKIVGSSLASVGPEVDDEADEFEVTTKSEDTTKGLFTSEPSSRRYKNSQGTEKEAVLEAASGKFTLEGRAAEEEENAAETIEDESAKESLSLEGGADDLGFEK
jgi:hypothetical protein